MDPRKAKERTEGLTNRRRGRPIGGSREHNANALYVRMRQNIMPDRTNPPDVVGDLPEGNG